MEMALTSSFVGDMVCTVKTIGSELNSQVYWSMSHHGTLSSQMSCSTHRRDDPLKVAGSSWHGGFQEDFKFFINSSRVPVVGGDPTRSAGSG